MADTFGNIGQPKDKSMEVSFEAKDATSCVLYGSSKDPSWQKAVYDDDNTSSTSELAGTSEAVNQMMMSEDMAVLEGNTEGTSDFGSEHTKKRYQCGFCDYTCNNTGHLKTHVKSHTGERPHACTVCHCRFAHAWHLKSHVRTHTGEKPFACTLCGYKSAEPGSLKRHMRIHTGEKPYACNSCDMRFSQPAYLKSHTTKMHLNTS